MDICLFYKPLKLKDKEVNEEEFFRYLEALSVRTIISALVIDPLERAMKESKEREFLSTNFKVTKTFYSKSSVKWKNVTLALREFLKIRAEDSRTKRIKGLRYFSGIGYCIRQEDILKKIETEKKENTSGEKELRLNWPKKNKTEIYPEKITIPSLDYSILSLHNTAAGI